MPTYYDHEDFLDADQRFHELVCDAEQEPSDSELLDFLDHLLAANDSRVTMRENSEGAFRLKETNRKRSSESVRAAILQFMVDRYTREESNEEEGG
jgi:hypothetical protein